MKRGERITEENLIAESVKLAEAYQALSQKLGIAFVNAGRGMSALLSMASISQKQDTEPLPRGSMRI